MMRSTEQTITSQEAAKEAKAKIKMVRNTLATIIPEGKDEEPGESKDQESSSESESGDVKDEEKGTKELKTTDQPTRSQPQGKKEEKEEPTRKHGEEGRQGEKPEGTRIYIPEEKEEGMEIG